MLECECAIEDLRVSLQKKKTPLASLFSTLDVQRDGFITSEDFIKFLIKSDISSTKSDVKLLIQRFDRDCEGTITREEFIRELTQTPGNYGEGGDDAEFLVAILRLALYFG